MNHWSIVKAGRRMIRGAKERKNAMIYITETHMKDMHTCHELVWDLLPRDIADKHRVSFMVLVNENILGSVQKVQLSAAGRNEVAFSAA